jgi:Arc/MetJ family transcription regulator
MAYASGGAMGICMSVRRKSHNLDETLLRRAKRVLGVSTETDAIHAALRSVLVGEEAFADIRAVHGNNIFRSDFERAQRRGSRSG